MNTAICLFVGAAGVLIVFCAGLFAGAEHQAGRDDSLLYVSTIAGIGAGLILAAAVTA